MDSIGMILALDASNEISVQSLYLTYGLGEAIVWAGAILKESFCLLRYIMTEKLDLC